LYGNLRKDKPTDTQLEQGETYPPGYCHYPKYDAEYFKQLTAERLVTVKDKRGFPHREWRKLRERNEALDCRVYARAAASACGIDKFTPSHWAQKAVALGQERLIAAETLPSTPKLRRKTLPSLYLG
jgi:phage terminase large subunit GpA-like protein